MKYRIARDNWLLSILGVMIGSFIFGNLLRTWWLDIIMALLWALASWFIGAWVWNRLFPSYLTFTDVGISMGRIRYSVDSIESISMPIGKKVRIGVYLHFPLKPVQITPWKIEDDELRDQLKRWSASHGVTFQEPIIK